MITSLNEYFIEWVLNWMSNSLNDYFTGWVLHRMSISLNEHLTECVLHVSSQALIMQHAALWNEKKWNYPSLASCLVFFSRTSHLNCIITQIQFPKIWFIHSYTSESSSDVLFFFIFYCIVFYHETIMHHNTSVFTWRHVRI